MKKILITGVAGFIGYHLSEKLLNNNYHIIGIDNLNDYYDPKLKNARLDNIITLSNFEFHKVDFINNNARLMVNVFGFLQKYNVPFVFASSQMSNMSHSPYGTLKRVGELYTQTIGGLIVKFWNVYGIENDPDKAHVITDFIRKGFEEGDFTMMTDGTEERQFLYAEDCCEGLETVMDCYADFKPTDPLHITSFNSTTIKEVAAIISGQFNRINRPITITPGIAKDSVQMDKKNEADVHISGWWLPKTPLHEGITKVFDDMKEQYDKG